MNTNRKQKKGFLIAEVIVALGIIITVTTVVYTILIRSLESNAYLRDGMQAMTLSIEGIEGVRQVRDTNWLKFGYDKKNCWHVISGDCATGTKITDGHYRLEMDQDQFYLERIGSDAVDLSDGTNATDDEYNLFLIDILPNVDSDGDGTKTNDKEATGYPNGPLPGTAEPTKFYRDITLDFDPLDPDILNVNSRVTWKAFGKVKSVELSTKLTNFNAY